MPYCTECGSELSQSDRFCAECGNPVDDPTTESQETDTTTESSNSHETEHNETSSMYWSRNANWVYGGRGVGGKLKFYNDRLVFESHAAERSESLFSTMGFLGKYLRLFPKEIYQEGTAEGTEMGLDRIEEVGKEPPRHRGFRDTLYAGGIRTRLRIDMAGDREELFVISNVGEVESEIRDAIRSSGVVIDR